MAGTLSAPSTERSECIEAWIVKGYGFHKKKAKPCAGQRSSEMGDGTQGTCRVLAVERPTTPRREEGRNENRSRGNGLGVENPDPITSLEGGQVGRGAEALANPVSTPMLS